LSGKSPGRDVPWPTEVSASSLKRPNALPAAPTVLVVDGEGVTRRYLESALSRDGRFEVESAKDALGALEILRAAPVDLVVSELTLEGMSGFQFLRRVREYSQLRHVGVVCYSSDSRLSAKQEAFRAGVDDFIVKPCDGQELAVRLANLVKRHNARRAQSGRKLFVLAGELGSVHVVDLVRILGLGKRTGQLSVETPRASANVFFRDGRITHALFGNLSGPSAFYKLLAEPFGRFEFYPGNDALVDVGPAIAKTPQELITEGERIRLTESNRTRTPKPSAVAAAAAPGTGEILARSVKTAAQLTRAVADDTQVGELRLWQLEELYRWYRTEKASRGFHAILLGKREDAIAALLSLAESPGRREILQGLSAEEKTLGVVFHLPGERSLDVVAVEISRTDLFFKCVKRPLQLALVMPPEGEFLAIPEASRTALDLQLTKLSPEVLVGVGNEALRAYLERLECILRGRTALRRKVERGMSDLRTLLVEGLQAWGALAKSDEGGVKYV